MPDRAIDTPNDRALGPDRLQSPERCNALLAAVAAHDTIDPDARLPDVLRIGYDAALLSQSYWIARQLWRAVDRAALARIALRIAAGGGLAPDQMRSFRDVRARAKQLRFAYAMLAAGHGYPVRLDRLARLMGQAQDAIRAGRPFKARLRGVRLRLAASRRQWTALDRELDAFVLTTPVDLNAYLSREIDAVEAALARPAITDKVFHDTRKVVSRLVAFYDTMTVLAPSPEHTAIDRYLSTINGMMGMIHDDMAIGKARSRRGYHEEARALPIEIAERLGRLVMAFRAAQPRG